MDAKVLTQLLTEYGNAKKEGDKFLLSQDLSITMFAVLGDSNLVVERVQEVGLSGDLVSVRTSRSEQYVFLAMDIRAIKVTQSKAKAGYGAH